MPGIFLEHIAVRKDVHSNNVIYHLSPGVPPGDFFLSLPKAPFHSEAVFKPLSVCQYLSIG